VPVQLPQAITIAGPAEKQKKRKKKEEKKNAGERRRKKEETRGREETGRMKMKHGLKEGNDVQKNEQGRHGIDEGKRKKTAAITKCSQQVKIQGQIRKITAQNQAH
jgi:hypothetical protein